MKRVISCVLLMLVLTSNAFALEVPTDTVVQNTSTAVSKRSKPLQYPLSRTLRH